MEVIKRSVYEAKSYSEFGGSSLIGYFKSQSDANKASEGKGEWGANGSVKMIDLEIKIFDNYEEYHNDILSNKVEKLNLTPEQIAYIKDNM